MSSIVTTRADITYIATGLRKGDAPGVGRAFALLRQAVDIAPEDNVLLFREVERYLVEKNNPVSHVVAALHCLYAADDIMQFKPAVIQLSTSKSRRIRLAVAMRLANFAVWDDTVEMRYVDDEIVATTLRLTNDSSPSVRDWALFQFNNGIDNDSAAIRKAIASRLHDPALTVRQEALAALVIRGETKYYPIVKQKLRHIGAADIWIRAAAASGDMAFLPELERLAKRREASGTYVTYAPAVREAIDEMARGGR